jgi:putative PIN family toxin of toxin-antitoxin system
MLEEVERVLHYPRLLKLFGLTEAEIFQFLTFLAASAEIVESDQTLTIPIRDLNDAHVLQTAVSGRADYVCTLDKHFKDGPVVSFCSNSGMAVVSDVELLQVIRQL